MNAVQPFPVVLFTNSWLMGGMEEHILLLGRGLVRGGFPVAALCPPREEIRPLRQALSEAGVQVRCLDERAASPLGTAHRLYALVRALRRSPGCVLHLHLTGFAGGELALLAGRLARARAIVRTEHLPPVLPVSDRDRRWVQWRDRFLARIICVSEQTRRDHLQWLGRDARKCTVVPNCVDLERFSPRAGADGVYAELGLDPSDTVIGTVSRLGEQRKGVSYFLEMAATVASVCPKTRFLVVGEGPLRPALERQAETLGLGRKIIFTGERRDVPRLLAAMRVFVMPSLYEGGPLTVLEAMAMAKPVVSTPVGLVPEVIDDGSTGLLVPVGNGAALAGAVLSLLADEALAHRLGQRGRDVVARRFSLDAMVDGVVNVYREVA